MPPCDTCIPPVLPENEEALRVYSMVSNQIIMVGMGEVIDVDFNAVKFVLDLYEIKDKKRVFEKVVETIRFFIKEAREKQKR